LHPILTGKIGTTAECRRFSKTEETAMSDDTELQKHLSAQGAVVVTPDGPQPYKVEFRLDGEVLAEYPVGSIEEGERLIRETTGHGKPHPFLGSVPDIKAPRTPD
jgi:hypothetical protein